MSANPKFILGGVQQNAPIEWQDVTITATFDQEAVQASISTEQFTFVNQAAAFIRAYREGGLTGTSKGIFEGLPLEIPVTDGINTFQSFKGFLDFSRDYIELSPVKVQARVKAEEGLNTLFDRAAATTYGYIENQGGIGQNHYIDIDYVVEKEINFVELAITGITLFILNKELASSIRRIVGYIANIVALTTASAPVPVAGLLYAAAVLILEIIYAAIITVQIINLTQQLIEQFISPIRQHKAITLETALEKGLEFLGYNLDSNLSQLSQVAYLPSSPEEAEELDSGIPKAQDFGYTVMEMIQLTRRLYNTKEAVVGSDVWIKTESDPDWVQNATYQMPDTVPLAETRRYNVEELKANHLIQFETDQQDGWTIFNFEGTNVEAIRTPNSTSNEKHLLYTGLERTQIPCALGSRKEELNEVEEALLVVAQLADNVVNFFGGNSNLAAGIEDRVGMLKVTQPAHSKPKLLFQDNGKLPANHRTEFNARKLYEDYHIFKSFAGPDFTGQKLTFEEIRIPFGFDNFLALINNSYFTTSDNKVGKFTKLVWNIAGDFATADFWIREPYNKNIKEQLIEG